jgi:hypothetical protein
MHSSRIAVTVLCSLLLAGLGCNNGQGDGGGGPPAGTGGTSAGGSGGTASANTGGTTGTATGSGGTATATGGTDSGSGGTSAGTGGSSTGTGGSETPPSSDAGAPTDTAAPVDMASAGGGRIADGFSQLLVSRSIGLGYYHACHLLASRDIKCYGDPQTEPRMTPPKIKSNQIFCAHNGCCVLTGQGAAPAPVDLPAGAIPLTINAKRLTCWGHKNTFFPPAAMDMDPITFGVGYDHGCVLNSDHTVKCWGQPGTMNAPPEGLTAKSLAIAAFFNCAVKMDDSVVCWGINPPQPPPGLKAKLVAAIFHGSPKLPDAPKGTRHACAIQLDDTVACWGDNIDGTTVVPADLGPVKDVAVATFNTCALKLDGTPVCWGTRKYNEIAERFHPMPSGLKLKGIRSKLATYCGLQMDDTMACWGDESSTHITIPAGTKFYSQTATP